MHHKRPQLHFINAALIYALDAEEQQASPHSCDWAIKQSTKAAQEPEMLPEPVPEPALEPFAREAHAGPMDAWQSWGVATCGFSTYEMIGS